MGREWQVTVQTTTTSVATVFANDKDEAVEKVEHGDVEDWDDGHWMDADVEYLDVEEVGA